ncbi:MAG: ferrous iron transporter B, partial [Bradyrhizobium sp.]|nr:ferrous iron transporter B [Bradyrhizobium sp.]
MEAPLMHLALVGTPNSGKTSLFNALTGSRQKVANYPGVTVERKEGSFVTPLGRQVSLVDLPGTYSLRGRSPDEEITRDVVLGRTPGEAVPDLVLCVADSTNLRLTIRLVLELKSTGRPLLLVLNMFDIATRRGVTVDVARLSEALGVPVVTSIAVRKGGTADLLRRTDEISAQAPVPLQQNLWQPLTVAGLRATQRQADRIIAATISLPTRPDTWTARIDAVVLHPVAGLAILALILFVMFQAVFAWAQPLMDLLSAAFTALGQLVHDTLPAGLLQSFLQNGVISGVGSVIVFLPQIIIIFLFILLLEDFGYMARAAFLMDRIMGGAGLHGRAFIPLLSSFACAIPGIMATRVIDNRRDRLTTILIAPLMTCSARIPVYTLIISAFIPARQIGGWVNLQGLVMFGLYAAGIASALGVSFVIKFFMLRDYAPAPFMLELPDYKMPRAGSIAIGIYNRAKMFLQRAGTTIFSMMVLIWFLASFPLPPAGATDPAINYSFAAMIGKALEPLLMPIGFNWQIAVALIPGMAAREVAVAALGTVYAIEGGKEAAEQIGQVLATKWSLAT